MPQIEHPTDDDDVDVTPDDLKFDLPSRGESRPSTEAIGAIVGHLTEPRRAILRALDDPAGADDGDRGPSGVSLFGQYRGRDDTPKSKDEALAYFNHDMTALAHWGLVRSFGKIAGGIGRPDRTRVALTGRAERLLSVDGDVFTATADPDDRPSISEFRWSEIPLPPALAFRELHLQLLRSGAIDEGVAPC
jgi:hypothetical protein